MSLRFHSPFVTRLRPEAGNDLLSNPASPRHCRLVWVIFSIFVAGAWLTGSLSAADTPPPPPRVLYIGDSFSVGSFGETVQASLVRSLGRSQLWLYASCGSSIQHWLSSEPVFYTPCGYREITPASQRLADHHGKTKPPRMPTPKIEGLLAKARPDCLIVQLGTNHFDDLEREGSAGIPKLDDSLERFARAVVRSANAPRAVVWITPPDSARFPNWIEVVVDSAIAKVASRHRFDLINSRRLTHYERGRTGPDGVHYLKPAATAWASRVLPPLNQMLSKPRPQGRWLSNSAIR